MSEQVRVSYKGAHNRWVTALVSKGHRSSVRAGQGHRFSENKPKREIGSDTGKWNEVKAKVLYLLVLQAIADGNVISEPDNKYKHRYTVINACDLHDSTWLTAKDMHEYTGVPLRSLYTLLPRWERWDYIERKQLDSDYHTYEWGYRILPKGVFFMDRFGSYVLPIERFNKEIVEWQKMQGIL